MPETQLSLASNSAELERLIQTANKFIHSAKSPATLRAYQSDWRHFETWCHKHRLNSLPATPQTVALYVADSASTFKSGTITRRLTSITKAHQAAGFAESPASTHHMVVGETLKGIRRTIGTAQKGKDPLLTADIRKIVRACPNTLIGLRDRALTLVGFSGGFRRSELARIQRRDLTFSRAASSSRCQCRKQIRKAKAARLVCHSVLTRKPVRFARYVRGSPRPALRKGMSSAE